MKTSQLQIRNKHTIVICLAFFSIIFIASPTFANTKNLRTGCDQTTGSCSGISTGGGGSHNQNNSATNGQFAGRANVRFDGYSPDLALTPCVKKNSDLKKFGYSANHPGPFYEHYRVAKDRKTDEVLAGVNSAKYWHTAWNIETLQPVDSAPSYNVIAAYYQFKNSPVMCLPLKGGFEIKAEQTGNKPIVSLNQSGKIVVNSKNTQMTIVADKTDLIKPNGSIFFNLDENKTSVAVSKQKQDGTWEELDLATSMKTIKLSAISSSGDGKTFTSKLEVKKKGTYKFSVKVHFDVDILVNSIFTQDFLEIESEELTVNSISVKSISRK